MQGRAGKKWLENLPCEIRLSILTIAESGAYVVPQHLRHQKTSKERRSVKSLTFAAIKAT
jgi:hypothetical protein